jgi:hypothetical protein
MKAKSLLACSLLTLSMARPLLAQSANVDEARDHFSKGVEFFKDQSYDAALAEFQRAYSISPNYRLLYNLAQVQLERHDYAAALKYLQDYLAGGGSEIDADRRAQVTADVSRLKSKVARLLVRADVEGADVAIEGAVVAKTPMAASIVVNPGVVHLRVTREGYRAETRTLTVVSADEQIVSIMLSRDASGAAPGAATAREDTPDSGAELARPAPAEPRRSYTAAWVSLGATGVLGVGTALFALRTHNASSDLDDRLNTFPSEASRISDARSDLKTAALVTDILAASTAVAAGLTLYFALSPSTEAASERNRAGFGVAPAPGGVVLFGRL